MHPIAMPTHAPEHQVKEGMPAAAHRSQDTPLVQLRLAPLPPRALVVLAATVNASASASTGLAVQGQREVVEEDGVELAKLGEHLLPVACRMDGRFWMGEQRRRSRPTDTTRHGGTDGPGTTSTAPEGLARRASSAHECARSRTAASGSMTMCRFGRRRWMALAE